MEPLALGVYILGVLMLVGGVLYFIMTKHKRGIVIALLGVVIAVLPFAINIWLMH